jgi:hypothetical protein
VPRGGFSDARFHTWRPTLGGMAASEAARLRELERIFSTGPKEFFSWSAQSQPCRQVHFRPDDDARTTASLDENYLGLRTMRLLEAGDFRFAGIATECL